MAENKLRQWLEQTKTTQLQLAELTGISQTQLTKYVNGLVQPGIDNAAAIEKATGGAVTFSSWVRTKRQSQRSFPASRKSKPQRVA